MNLLWCFLLFLVLSFASQLSFIFLATQFSAPIFTIHEDLPHISVSLNTSYLPSTSGLPAPTFSSPSPLGRLWLHQRVVLIDFSCWFRAAGSLVVMDPYQICRKTRRLRGKLADICNNEPALLKQISNGVFMGQKECQYQFRHRRWNCTSSRRSMRKVLLRGRSFND